MKTTRSLIVAFATAILATLPILAAGLTYTKPDPWVAVKTTSSMRVAQFTIPRAPGDTADAEVVLYYFGGSGGTVDANIERWIAQIQQADGRASSAVAKRSSRTVNGLEVTLVDVSGTYVAEVTPGSAERHPRNYRLRAGVLNTPKGPYFVKLTGPAKTVAAAEALFDRFLGSLRYEA